MKFRDLRNICIRNGAIAGALLVLLMIAMYYMGRHPFLIAPFLDFRIIAFAVFMFFSLKEFRDYYQEGILHFWQGLIGSGILVLTAAVISGLGVYIFTLLEHDFVKDYIEKFTVYFRSFPKEEIELMGKEQFERNLKNVQSTNGLRLAQDYFGKGLIIGLPVSIIMSVFLRKQPKP